MSTSHLPADTQILQTVQISKHLLTHFMNSDTQIESEYSFHSIP